MIEPEIRIVHYTINGIVYWSGYGHGADGQGWTDRRSEALVFLSCDAAVAERRVAREYHPTMLIRMAGEWL